MKSIKTYMSWACQLKQQQILKMLLLSLLGSKIIQVVGFYKLRMTKAI